MIDTNATTKAHKSIVDAFTAAAGGDADFIDAALVFDTKAKTVSITYADANVDATLPYEDAKALIARNFQAAPEPDAVADVVADVPAPKKAAKAEPAPFSPQPKPGAKGKAAKEATPKAPKAAPKPAPEPKAEVGEAPDSPRILKLRAQLDTEAHSLADDIDRERTGELSSTAARYAKGKHLSAMEGIANELKNAGDPEFSKRGASRAFARSVLEERMTGRHGLIDPKDRLSDQEVTYATKVYDTYLKHQGGLDATFRAVDAIDRQTKQPLANDAGDPYEFPVTNIALQKLYILERFYLDEHRDTILSFAHRNSQKVVTAAAKLMDEHTGNIADVIEAINKAQANAQDDDLSPDDAALDYVAQEKGETPPSTVKSIKVDAGWFQGDWTDIKRVASQVAVSFGLPLDDKGEVGNTFLLERLMSVFIPREHGASNIVHILVETDTITEAQAKKFLTEYANVPGDTLVADAPDAGVDEESDENEGEQDG